MLTPPSFVEEFDAKTTITVVCSRDSRLADQLNGPNDVLALAGTLDGELVNHLVR